MALANVLLTAIIILVACIPCIQCTDRNATSCSQSCSIWISSTSNIRNIRLKIRLQNNHVLYLSLRDRHQKLLLQSSENTVFAWIRLDFGQSLMTMPIDFYVLSSLLPLLFEDVVNITVHQYPDNCYKQLNTAVRDDCTFKALKQLANVNLACTGQECGTICKRDINTTTPLDDITFTCCRILNFAEVCDEPISTPKVVVAFRYISFLLSVILAAGWLKWFIRDVPMVQRKENIGSSTTPEYIKLRLISRYQYEGIGDRARRFMYQTTVRSMLWTRYIILYVVTMIGFITSAWIQFHPYHFIPIPKLNYIAFPSQMYVAFKAVAIIYACLVIIVIIPIFHCGGEQKENAIAYRNEKILKYTETDFMFRLSWYIDKLIKLAIKLCHNYCCGIQTWYKFLSLFIVIMFCIPFAIINKLSLEYYAFRKADIIAYRLYQKFDCEGEELSQAKSIFKAILYIISVLYCAMTMFLVWTCLVLIIRIVITSVAFLAAHSNYFSSYMAPAVPLIYFVKQALQNYSRNKIFISKGILDLKEQVESDVEEYLSANEGKLEILFVITYKGVDVDLPIRLENLRETIRHKIESIAKQHDIRYQQEEQSIIVTFKSDGVDSEGKTIYKVQFSQFDDKLDDLRHKIMAELSHQQMAYLRINLKKFYYDIRDDTFEVTDVGICSKFYYYLSNQAPRLATSFRQLMVHIVATGAIAAFFLTAIASFNNIYNISSLANALSGTILSYATMMTSMSYFISNEFSDEEKQQILKKYIIDYILGYTFFYRRGKTIQPLYSFYHVLHRYKTMKNEMFPSAAVV